MSDLMFRRFSRAGIANDTEARRVLRNAVIRARRTLLTDTSDLLALCDDLGSVLEQVDGEWPDFDIEEEEQRAQPGEPGWGDPINKRPAMKLQPRQAKTKRAKAKP